MVSPMVAGAGIQAVGTILGGAARSKAAKKAKKQTEEAADIANAQITAISTAADSANVQRRNDDIAQLRALLQGDQARATAVARADEARLAGMSGVDFGKLVADAKAAGFNPLTAIQMAGTGAYERRNAFIASPFIGEAGAFVPTPLYDPTSVISGVQQGFEARTGANRDVAGTGGYFGDAVAGFGQNFIGISQEHARLQQDAELAKAMMRPAPQQARAAKVDARPTSMASVVWSDEWMATASPFDWIPVFQMGGGIQRLGAGVAKRAGVNAFDTLVGQDHETIMGEIASEIQTGGEILDATVTGGGTPVFIPWENPPRALPPARSRPVPVKDTTIAPGRGVRWK